MTSKEEILDNVSVEQIQDNMETGIIMAIDEKKAELKTQLKDLSKKELVRLINNAANFPQPVSVTGGAEKTATETLYTIKDLQIEMALISIGKLQEDNDNKESEGEDDEA